MFYLLLIPPDWKLERGVWKMALFFYLKLECRLENGAFFPEVRMRRLAELCVGDSGSKPEPPKPTLQLRPGVEDTTASLGETRCPAKDV